MKRLLFIATSLLCWATLFAKVGTLSPTKAAPNSALTAQSPTHAAPSPSKAAPSSALAAIADTLSPEQKALSEQIYQMFNRQSLVGCKAQALELQDTLGTTLNVSPQTTGRCSVIYFYDVSCGKCALESVILKSILENGNYPVDAYLICISPEREKWLKYVREYFPLGDTRSRIFHLYDPDRSYDYQLKYGVLATPKLFLTDESGTIVGRGLEPTELERMLSEKFIAPELEYGSEEGLELYDKVFGAFDPIAPDDLMMVADHVEKRTLSRNDTTLFRQMTGDLLYWLSYQRDEALKMSEADFIDSKILSRPEIWKSSDDSLKVVNMASMMKGLSGKTPIGSKIPDVAFTGELHNRFDRIRRVRSRQYSLRRLRAKENILFFYVDMCYECSLEKQAALEYLKANKKTNILFVNMPKAVEADPTLLDSFDLSAAPFLISFDKDGIVRRKYFSLVQ